MKRQNGQKAYESSQRTAGLAAQEALRLRQQKCGHIKR